MKNLVMFFVVTSFIFFGCQDENSLLEPSIHYKAENLTKKDKNGFTDWFNSKSLTTSTDNGFSIYSKSYTINGKKGGTITESNFFWVDSNGNRVSMSATLTIPKGAFKGNLTFDITFDLENLSVQLSPSPFTFNKPVSLDLMFWGVDLTGIDPNSAEFVYLSPDGITQSVQYSSKKIVPTLKYLEVKGAKLPHFSRYGWLR